MIDVNHLVKRYGQAAVLNDVTVQFEREKIHGLIGRNGSGKTMLIRCICGLIRPTSGTITVDGARVVDGVIPKNLGAIVETPGFLPYYSGMRNLLLLASIQKRVEKTIVQEAMRMVGLDPGSRKWVSKYSMGMKQRLGIAQAVMEDPDLLLLDEPMNGLDNAGVKDMRALFKALRARGKTILLASHNLQDIEELCDTVCEMDLGTLTRVR
ncbi:MAG: ATP-binding cassette domain-containing protein [Christensenellaceae bacterium]|nr:ATP-binding cassette domain-containing protein [Christensenellaceae bacterium]MEA5066619.1 ATP-binding cassette domain-containing protein [Eubacteriales bacterium]MEA5070101.1 ATP-binding cassette domain-containing protein [Christensenellaceae bacterium]